MEEESQYCNFGIPLDYLVLLDYEIRDLTVLLEANFNQFSVDK